MAVFPPSELILHPDGSLYHIRLREEHVADTVLVVGDPGRVQRISRHFDRLEHTIENREFVTHVGTIGSLRLTVLATGIGTDNIDIVLNELDAAVNIDPVSRETKSKLRKLRLIRLGTTGALQEDIPVDSLLLSAGAIGLDGLLHFYDAPPSEEERDLEQALKTHLNASGNAPTYYIRMADSGLIDLLEGPSIQKGLTVTASGFYAPQGRHLRIPLADPQRVEKYRSFRYRGQRITNFEMETSALYGLGEALGHACCTLCTVLANRVTGTFSADHHAAENRLIQYVLGKLTA